MIGVSTFEDRFILMCRLSKIDSRCVDLRTSIVDVKLGAILAQNIDTIAVCELRQGFALQCFH